MSFLPELENTLEKKLRLLPSFELAVSLTAGLLGAAPCPSDACCAWTPDARPTEFAGVLGAVVNVSGFCGVDGFEGAKAGVARGGVGERA